MLDSDSLEKEQVVGLCEHSNELQDSAEVWIIFLR
jgi:hypothetical protein